MSERATETRSEKRGEPTVTSHPRSPERRAGTWCSPLSTPRRLVPHPIPAFNPKCYPSSAISWGGSGQPSVQAGCASIRLLELAAYLTPAFGRFQYFRSCDVPLWPSQSALSSAHGPRGRQQHPGAPSEPSSVAPAGAPPSASCLPLTGVPYWPAQKPQHLYHRHRGVPFYTGLSNLCLFARVAPQDPLPPTTTSAVGPGINGTWQPRGSISGRPTVPPW